MRSRADAQRVIDLAEELEKEDNLRTLEAEKKVAQKTINDLRDEIERRDQEYQEKLTELEAQKNSANDRLTQRDSEIASLQRRESDLLEQSRIEAEARMAPIEKDGDVWIENGIRYNRHKNLTNISNSYEDALAKLKLRANQDRNKEIMERVRKKNVPFFESQEYLMKREIYEKAQEALQRAEEEGPEFVNVEAAKKMIFQRDKEKQRYEEDAASIDGLRGALEGKRVEHLLITEQDDNNYMINLVMFIKDRNSSTEFSPLERDLISHVNNEWSGLLNRGEIPHHPDQDSLKKSSRQGFVQYTFLIPKEGVSAKQVRHVVQRLEDSIYESQKDYPFGALGLTVDLQVVSSTRGMPIESEKGLVKMASKEEVQARQEQAMAREEPEVERVEEVTPAETADVSQDDYVARIKAQYQSFPYSKIRIMEGSRASEIKNALLVGLAEAEKPLLISELREVMQPMIPDFDLSVRDNQTRVTQEIHRLMRDGYVEKIPDPDVVRRATYRIPEKYKVAKKLDFEEDDPEKIRQEARRRLGEYGDRLSSGEAMHVVGKSGNSSATITAKELEEMDSSYVSREQSPGNRRRRLVFSREGLMAYINSRTPMPTYGWKKEN